jgi:hypothetical protein
MPLIDTVAKAWSWKGLVAKQIVDQNLFGNPIVADSQGRYWRICPEELSCQEIATSEEGYRQHRADPNFLTDWMMSELCALALETLGPVTEERCYCLKMPAVLGGEYSETNLGTISRDELIAFSGDLARQIEGLPDGAQIQVKFAE